MLSSILNGKRISLPVFRSEIDFQDLQNFEHQLIELHEKRVNLNPKALLFYGYINATDYDDYVTVRVEAMQRGQSVDLTLRELYDEEKTKSNMNLRSVLDGYNRVKATQARYQPGVSDRTLAQIQILSSILEEADFVETHDATLTDRLDFLMTLKETQ